MPKSSLSKTFSVEFDQMSLHIVIMHCHTCIVLFFGNKIRGVTLLPTCHCVLCNFWHKNTDFLGMRQKFWHFCSLTFACKLIAHSLRYYQYLECCAILERNIQPVHAQYALTQIAKSFQIGQFFSQIVTGKCFVLKILKEKCSILIGC